MADGPDKRNPLAPYFPSDTPRVPTLGQSRGALALLLIFAFSLLLFIVFWGTALL